MPTMTRFLLPTTDFTERSTDAERPLSKKTLKSLLPSTAKNTAARPHPNTAATRATCHSVCFYLPSKTPTFGAFDASREKNANWFA